MTTPTIAIFRIAVNSDIHVRGVAPDPAVSDVADGIGDNQQIIVVLDDVIYDAEVAVDAWTALSSTETLVRTILPDGDYIMAVAISEFSGSCLTLHALSIRRNGFDELSLTDYDTGDLLDGKIRADFGTTPALARLPSGHHVRNSLAEESEAWVAHSARNSFKRAKMTLRSSTGCIVVPSNLLLTPRVIVGAIGRLSPPQIEEVVEGLINVLDCRGNDADLELDSDLEGEVDEENCQAV